MVKSLGMVTLAVRDKSSSRFLFSQSWYRVAGLVPKLRSHTQIHRHIYRGEDWYVLQDHSTGRFHRFTPEAYLIIGFMDGVRTVDDIWKAACARLGDDMPGQDEVIDLLVQLNSVDALQSDILPDVGDLHQRYTRQKRSKWLSAIYSPVALRFPLFDPERFLQYTKRLVNPLFGWPGAIVWSLFVIYAFVLAGMHWGELTGNISDRVLSVENLVLLWFIYPVVKAFHEFGHAYAVKRWGGEVHEMGVMLLVFVPVPYVDASASSAFRSKYERMLVGGAGILVEVFIAALAMVVWVNVEPGALRAVAFNVIILTTFSTLLFNGNPLLRFDAYYVLSDFLEIPNLGAKANKYAGYLFRRYLVGSDDSDNPASTRSEAAWLLTYAVTSFVYRIFITIRIILFVAGKFFVLGLLIALWTGINSVVIPIYKGLRSFINNPQIKSAKARVYIISFVTVSLFLAFILWMPMPSFTMAEGVVWVSEDSRVHAGADGFIVRVVAEPGKHVVRGEVLIECEAPELTAQVKLSRARLKEMQARHRAAFSVDPAHALILEDEIRRQSAELASVTAELDALKVKSPNDGIFLMDRVIDMPGHYVTKGMPMAYVVDFSRTTVRVVVDQTEIERVTNSLRSVHARLSGDLSTRRPATLIRRVPAATKELPSLALSVEGGGGVALDPALSGAPQAFEKFFLLDLRVEGKMIERVGERVFVRFTHDPEPYATRWYRVIRRTFLRRFDV